MNLSQLLNGVQQISHQPFFQVRTYLLSGIDIEPVVVPKLIHLNQLCDVLSTLLTNITELCSFLLDFAGLLVHRVVLPLNFGGQWLFLVDFLPNLLQSVTMHSLGGS